MCLLKAENKPAVNCAYYDKVASYSKRSFFPPRTIVIIIPTAFPLEGYEGQGVMFQIGSLKPPCSFSFIYLCVLLVYLFGFLV